MTNLDSILKRITFANITLPTKVRLVKAMVFPVVMYGCESWTVKKAEHWRIDAFEVWCWRRLLRVPWTARRANQFILKEVSPGCSLEGLMLKLKLQYFGHLMWRVDSLEKTLMLGGIGGRRRRGWQRMRWLDGITDSMDMSLSSRSWWRTGRPGVLRFMGSQRVKHNWVTELNWTELNWTLLQKERIMPASCSVVAVPTSIIALISPCCIYAGLPWWFSDEESAYPCGRPGFNPWVRKIPWRRKWQATAVLLPGKSHG